MNEYDKTSIQINRCKRILALVDDYVEKQDAGTRTDLRKALMEEFEASAIAPPVAADAEPLEVMRANFEDWYTTHASDIKAAPIGSRDSMLQWSSWIAARSGNYVARGGWEISPMPWGPAGEPVAAGSVDTEALRKLALAATPGDQWRMINDGGQFGLRVNSGYQGFFNHQRPNQKCTDEVFANVAYILAVKPSVVLALLERAEKAEADLKQVNEWRAAALASNQQMQELMAAKLSTAEARVKELEGSITKTSNPFYIKVPIKGTPV